MRLGLRGFVCRCRISGLGFGVRVGGFISGFSRVFSQGPLLGVGWNSKAHLRFLSMRVLAAPTWGLGFRV